jgi:hypothetical protein
MQYQDTSRLQNVCRRLTNDIISIKCELHTGFMKQDKQLSALLEYVNIVLDLDSLANNSSSGCNGLFPDDTGE